MMKINKLSNSGLGIEITDIDLTKPLNEKNVNIIRIMIPKCFFKYIT